MRDLLTTLAPELAELPPETLDLFLELAADLISAAVFGKVYRHALATLAAHLATMAVRAQQAGVAAGGPVTSVGTGGLSLSFGQPQATAGFTDAALASTSYGLQFLSLRATRAGVKAMLVRP